ncbi:MAG: NAD(P)-dependent oxidoreductase, partial [Erysipelotrichales bacterium]|nr:NAD(P)-dependent oxidoreductase [Erysipelotrichales bacterium]
YLDSKKQVIAKEDFTTAFSVANMHKDVHICLNMAEKAGLKMPGEENAARVYDKAMAEGLGGKDFSATVLAVREETK